MVKPLSRASGQENGRNPGFSYFTSFLRHRVPPYFIHRLPKTGHHSKKPGNQPLSNFMLFPNQRTNGNQVDATSKHALTNSRHVLRILPLTVPIA